MYFAPLRHSPTYRPRDGRGRYERGIGMGEGEMGNEDGDGEWGISGMRNEGGEEWGRVMGWELG